MNNFKKIALAAGLCAAGMTGAQTAAAQTTDGYHTMLSIPVVVDSASFTQRFIFRNPNDSTATLQPRYYPAETTSQAAMIICPSINITANGVTSITSLRTMCPALATGTQFGFMVFWETHTANIPVAAYSRVSNAQGAGFSVEGFPLNTFTSADATVTGLRRLAASGGNPAYQTNCFLGNIGELSNVGTGVSSNISYVLYDSAGTSIGSGSVDHVPGKMTRILDIFSAAGAPAGNYDDARIIFHELGTGEPGLITFCTVQDNTSFGADFRIAKQERGLDATYSGIGSQDQITTRDSTASADVLMAGDASLRAYTILAGPGHNDHVFYFRHPDQVSCEIINPATNARALAAYGLEMRMADSAGVVVAGGNEVYGFDSVWLGDKAIRNQGSNGRYVIQVESGSANAGADRPYRIHCQSGSGHTPGEMIRTGAPDIF